MFRAQHQARGLCLTQPVIVITGPTGQATFIPLICLTNTNNWENCRHSKQ